MVDAESYDGFETADIEGSFVVPTNAYAYELRILKVRRLDLL